VLVLGMGASGAGASSEATPAARGLFLASGGGFGDATRAEGGREAKKSTELNSLHNGGTKWWEAANKVAAQHEGKLALRVGDNRDGFDAKWKELARDGLRPTRFEIYGPSISRCASAAGARRRPSARLPNRA
jgi:hypothetical protein